MSDVVLSSRDGAVLTLTLNRPEALNALNRETTNALRTALEAAGRDPDIGAVVVTVEAMKMEHALAAPVDGVVELLVAVGDQVKVGQPLARITASTKEDES